MMQYIYAIAFLCLLRFDEVLQIEAHYVELINEIIDHIKLSLKFWKTHQYDDRLFNKIEQLLMFIKDIKSFHLYWNQEQKYLNVSHLLLWWLHVSCITSGFLFQRFDAHDWIDQSNKTIVSVQYY